MARKATTWSVKGIEEDVRDIARAAAERDEQTIGAWIDYAIRVHGGQRPRIEEKNLEIPSDPGEDSSAQSAVAMDVDARRRDPGALLALVDEELGASSRRLDSALRPMGLALLDLAERMVAMERRAPVQAEIAGPVPAAKAEADEVFDDDFGPEALPEIRPEPMPAGEDPETFQRRAPAAPPDIPPAPTYDLDGGLDRLDMPMLAQELQAQTPRAETDRAREIDRRLRALAGEVESAETDPSPPAGDLGPTEFGISLPPRETAEPLELPMAFRGVQQRGFESHPGQAARETAGRPRRRNGRTVRRSLLAAATMLVVAAAGLYAAADYVGLGRLKADVDQRLRPGLETATREAHRLWTATLDSAVPLLVELESMLLGAEEPEKAPEPPVDEVRRNSGSEPLSPELLPPEPLPEVPEPLAPLPDERSDASSARPQSEIAPSANGPVQETVGDAAGASEPSEAAQALPEPPIPAPASVEIAPEPRAALPVPVPEAAPAESVTELAPPPAPVLRERTGNSPAGEEVAALPSSGTQSSPSMPGNLRQRADAGDATAQHDLAIAYLTGEGVPENPARAAELLREAAIQGLASAQYNLAVLYETGQGVRKDDVRALLWYHSAAEQGHPNAQYNLGVMYAEGRGIPLNFEEAARWFRAAADQGVARALYNLGVMTDEGLGVARDKAAALDLYRAAAGAGDERAIDLLAGSGYQSVSPQAPLSGAEGLQAVPATPAKLVTDVQRELARLGLYDGRIDGLIGPKTRSAIRGFQKSRGAAEDGEASRELLEILRAAAR